MKMYGTQKMTLGQQLDADIMARRRHLVSPLVGQHKIICRSALSPLGLALVFLCLAATGLAVLGGAL